MSTVFDTVTAAAEEYPIISCAKIIIYKMAFDIIERWKASA